ncbi:MAG: hypothetical protein ACREGA_04305 [Candidatus Saccharimonadales bacterium]
MLSSQNEVIIIVVGLIVLGLASLLLRRRPRTLNQEYFRRQWQAVQSLCQDKSTWPLAIINGDQLLDEALKKLHFKGDTMGKRLVAAQRKLSNNDSTWQAHKLRNRLVHEADVGLKENDVKRSLVGIRQALKDLGAL